jgi:hypothetical protein
MKCGAWMLFVIHICHLTDIKASKTTHPAVGHIDFNILGQRDTLFLIFKNYETVGFIKL